MKHPSWSVNENKVISNRFKIFLSIHPTFVFRCLRNKLLLSREIINELNAPPHSNPLPQPLPHSCSSSSSSLISHLFFQSKLLLAAVARQQEILIAAIISWALLE